MDLRDLRYFEVLAELEHVGRAALKLHRSQPALTAAVRRLEEACGMPLLERSGRGIRLTPAGRVMLRWAQRTRFDVEDARRELAELGQGLAGEVRLGIVPTAAQFLLPTAMRRLMQEAPDVRLKTTVALVDRLRPALMAGDLDVMVATGNDAMQGVTSIALSEDQIVVAATGRHEIFGGTPKLRDLVGYRWVLQPPGAPTRDWLDDVFARKRLPRPVVQVESTMLILLPALIAETGLLSFISRHHLRPHTPESALLEVRLRETTMRRRLVATHRENAYLSPATQRLIALLAAAGREIG